MSACRGGVDKVGGLVEENPAKLQTENQLGPCRQVKRDGSTK